MPKRLRVAARRLLTKRNLGFLALLVLWEVAKDRFAGWANAGIDERSGPVMDFLWPYLQELAVAPLGYTVAVAIVVLLILFGHAYLSEGQEQAIPEPVVGPSGSVERDPSPDLNMSSAAFQIAGITENSNLGDNEVDKLTAALGRVRQLAHYGEITVWGKEITSSNSALGVWSPIPKDYWRSKEFNPILLVESSPDTVEKHTIIDGAAMGKAVNSPDYTDTYVNSAELAQAIGQETVVQPIQGPRQTVNIAANKLPNHGHMTFSHSLQRVPSKTETTLVCTSADNGYAVDDPIHGDFGFKTTMTEQNVTIYINGLSLQIPHKYEPGAWATLDVDKWKLRINIYD